MVVFLHVVIALFSIGIASFSFFRPSRTLLGSSYGLIVATIGSGMYLVISAPSHMLEACTTGLVYVGIVSMLTWAAKVRLAQLEQGTH